MADAQWLPHTLTPSVLFIQFLFATAQAYPGVVGKQKEWHATSTHAYFGMVRHATVILRSWCHEWSMDPIAYPSPP